MITETRPLHLWATCAVACLTVATAVSMSRLFTGWDYLAPMLVVVAVGHVLAVALRAARLHVLIALPLAMAGTLAAAGVVFHRGTALGGVIPTGDTIDVLRSDLRLVLDQFSVTVAPVPSRGAFAMAASALVGLCAPLADSFAFRAYGRGEAVVPSLVVFVFASALGADRNRIAVAAVWIGVALLTVVILRSEHRQDQEAWIGGRPPRLVRLAPAALILAALCASAAGAAAPHLPGAKERSLLDTRRRETETTEIVSPLVEIRSQLVNRSNTEMFTVEADRPAYWRLMGLASFDGNAWSPISEPLDDAGGRLSSSGEGSGDGSGEALFQKIRIRGLRGKIVPAAYAPTRLDTQVNVQWAGESQAILTLNDEPLQSGDTFSIESAIPETDPTRLAAATSTRPPGPIYLELPTGLPGEAVDIARRIMAGATTTYARALALQSFFRDTFTYSLDVPRGHGNDAMRQFLEIRTGYCEQFSATFAAIARLMGIPARVAVGFTPGDLRDDGLFHVAGRYAHAWPEVWFDDIGWVPFEPTPGRGAPGSEAVTGLPAQQDGEATPPPPDTTAGTSPADTSLSQESTPPPPAGQQSPPATPPTLAPEVQPADASSGLWWWLGALVALLGAWLVAMPEFVRRRRRARFGDTPTERVRSAWHEAERALAQSGSGHDPGLPAPAVAAATTAPVDRRALGQLADQVTRAMYSGAPPSAEDVSTSERLAAEIRHDCQRAQPWRRRLAALVNPRRVW